MSPVPAEFSWFFAIGSLCWTVLLFPILVNREARVPRWSSVPSFLLMFAYVGAYGMLGMPQPAIASLIGAVAWLFVARYRYVGVPVNVEAQT
jgi:hypothetical protein